MHIISTYRHRHRQPPQQQQHFCIVSHSFANRIFFSTLTSARSIYQDERREKPEKKRRRMISAYDYSSEMRKCMHNISSYALHKFKPTHLHDFCMICMQSGLLFFFFHFFRNCFSRLSARLMIECDVWSCQSYSQRQNHFAIVLYMFECSIFKCLNFIGGQSIEINCIAVGYIFDNKRNEEVKWYNFTFLKLHQLTFALCLFEQKKNDYYFGTLMETFLAWAKIQQQRNIFSWTNVKYM